jgi:isopenicillin N synthase-like dioxygenase
MTSHAAPSSDLAHIAIAPLPVIDFDKLWAGNDTEIARLVDICKSLGFFYLNLTGVSQTVLENSQNTFKFMEKYFDQPLEVKLRDIRQSVTHG